MAVILMASTHAKMQGKHLEENLQSYFKNVQAKYNGKLDLDRLQVDIPVVGILTMPSYDEDFPFDHFSWEHNINFIQYAGTYAAVIKYNEADEDLYPLLDSLNGVYFTGGPLDLFDDDTNEPHTYYKTARKIFDYAKKENDAARPFPIFAICQGFEIIHLLANKDNFTDTMANVDIYASSRKLNFMDRNPKETSKLMSGFPADLIEKMSS